MVDTSHRIETPPRVEEIVARIPEAPPGVTDIREEIARTAMFIAETFRPRRIMLYGSWAYGTPTPESDVDLMLEIETRGLSQDEQWRIQDAIPSSRICKIQIVVYSPKQVRRDLQEQSFFMRDIMLKGIALYERAGMEIDDDLDDEDDEPNDYVPGLKRVTQRWLRVAERDHRAVNLFLMGDDPVSTTPVSMLNSRPRRT